MGFITFAQAFAAMAAKMEQVGPCDAICEELFLNGACCLHLVVKDEIANAFVRDWEGPRDEHVRQWEREHLLPIPEEWLDAPQ